MRFAQVVCEEAPEAKKYGFKTKARQRFLAGVVTPAQPHYLHGLLDANQDPHLGMVPPILGVAASAGGYQVHGHPCAQQLNVSSQCRQKCLAGLVTPAQPYSIYGHLDANQDPHLGMAPRILGIAASSGSYQVHVLLSAKFSQSLQSKALQSVHGPGALQQHLYRHLPASTSW